MKLLSLFDGSGGFPLAASICGIEPLYASEVEPYPIAVTRSRFPDMKHLGDVSKINGAELEPVDIISFGSPCQDLSIAGKRAGMKHEENGDDETTRSGLFMEAIRIITEMREATNGKYPTFAIWENVPGAFSSNGGRDFKLVLESFIRIPEPNAPALPNLDDGDNWPKADVYLGNEWSVAYRTFDAQYWGVPQRRRRVFLVADFRGQHAGKILFERDGLRRDFASIFEQREEASRSFREGVKGTSYTLKIRGGAERDAAGRKAGKGALIQEEKSATLATSNDQTLFVPCTISLETFHCSYETEKVTTLKARDYKDPQVVAVQEPGRQRGKQYCFDNNGGYSLPSGPVDVAQTVLAYYGTGGNNQSFVVEHDPVYIIADNAINRSDTAGIGGNGWREDVSYTLNTFPPPAVMTENKVYSFDSLASNSMKSSNPFSGCHETEIARTLDTSDGNPSKNQGGNAVVESNYIVRRLTPTECARLQGFPDRWGDIDRIDEMDDEQYKFWLDVRKTYDAINGRSPKEYTKESITKWYNGLHSDANEYKMWGNGVALPCVLYIMEGIEKYI